METNPMLLKSSVFGGFKKKDVLSYIFELNESTQEERQKLAEQIEELVQSREKFASDVEEMDQQIAAIRINLDDTTDRLHEENKRSAQLSELVDKLKSEILKHESTIAQQNSELARHASLNAELTEKNRVLEEKRHQVELAASQIADLLGQAKEDAINLVERAKVEAEEIIENAKASLAGHLEETNKSIDGAYKKFGSFKSELLSLNKAISDATSAINAKMQELDNEVGRIEQFTPLTEENLATLSYKHEDEDIDPDDGENEAEPVPALDEAEAALNYTNDVLKRYGVRKDDSGFFRLAAEK